MASSSSFSSAGPAAQSFLASLQATLNRAAELSSSTYSENNAAKEVAENPVTTVGEHRPNTIAYLEQLAANLEKQSALKSAQDGNMFFYVINTQSCCNRCRT